MAAVAGRQVLRNCGLTVNSVDLSRRVEAVTVDLAAAIYDLTAIGQGGHIWTVGPRSDALTVTYWQDYSPGGVDDTLAGLASSSGFPVVVDTLLGPVYTGTCVLADYQPTQGKVGDGLVTTVRMPVVGELAVTGTG